MKYIFAIPTIMTRPKFEIENVETLAKDFPNSKVYFVSNVKDQDFESYKPKYSNIIKKISNKKFSISKALNCVIDEITTETYFVFVQSDLKFNPKYLDIFEQIHLLDNNTGVIGIRGHSPHHKKIPMNFFDEYPVYKVLWSDGIMFFKTSLIQSIGKFDENYLGDKESQDFCYRAYDKGYNNYNITLQYFHNSLPFSKKSKFNQQEFNTEVKNSSKYFLSKWGEWERKQVKQINNER